MTWLAKIPALPRTLGLMLAGAGLVWGIVWTVKALDAASGL